MWSFKLSAILVLQIVTLVNSHPGYEIQKSVELFSSDESDSSPEIYSRFSSSGESNENCGNSERYVNCHNSKPGQRVGQQPRFIPPGQLKKGHGREPFNNRPQHNHHNHNHKHNSNFSFNGPKLNHPYYPNHNQYTEHWYTSSPYDPQFPYRPQFAYHPQFPYQSQFPHQSQFPQQTQNPQQPQFSELPQFSQLQPQIPQQTQFQQQPQFPRQPTFPQSAGNTENQIPRGNKGNNKCRGNSRQNCRGDDGREQPRPQIPAQRCGSRNRPCQQNVQNPQPVRPAVQPLRTPPPVLATPQPTTQTTSTTPSTTTPSEEFPEIDIRFGDGDTTAKSFTL